MPGRRRVAAAILAHPGQHQAELARTVGMSRSTVHYHVASLLEAGLVRVSRAGVVRCWPLPVLAEALPEGRRTDATDLPGEGVARAMPKSDVVCRPGEHRGCLHDKARKKKP